VNPNNEKTGLAQLQTSKPKGAIYGAENNLRARLPDKVSA
jgi:hypothetical protein